MAYFINSTQAYHTNQLNSLGWELTVSNCLYPERSPCRTVLSKRSSYGSHLYEFLEENIALSHVKTILEIGGGYGYLMHDLLKCNRTFQVTMVDISPFLLGEQQKTLTGFPVSFLLSDALEIPEEILQNHDLIILNENVGDFPTAVDIPVSWILNRDGQGQDDIIRHICGLFDHYALLLPDREIFNFNLGAVLATEKLCRASVPAIFISEHSCEATVPDDFRELIPVSASGNPERIPLRGHDEYTIKFSHLAQVAAQHGYDCKRGPLADFIRLDFNDSLWWLLKRRHSTKDEHEILRHFVEDLYQYEYLLLTRQDN
jgi:hypothetical protein